MNKNDKDTVLESIEEKFKKEESEKKKAPMEVSGKSVFDIKRIKSDKFGKK